MSQSADELTVTEALGHRTLKDRPDNRQSNAQEALLPNQGAEVGEHVLMKRPRRLAQRASLGSPSSHFLLHLLGVQTVLPAGTPAPRQPVAPPAS
jgi:hypothetical protein